MRDEQKHTQGPFTVRGPRVVDMADDYAILSPDGEIIGEAFGRSAVSKFHPSDANARLFAAAPELLQALIHLAHNARKSGAEMGLALDVAEDAIAKATGAA